VRGLWKLTWLETKIFMREPLGALGTIVVPVASSSCSAGRTCRRRRPVARAQRACSPVDCRSLVAILIAISAVLSLVTIISIYREGGILKRLRATPLRPQTILSAHVLVKLLLTAATLA
jgi:ABC-2 type transport system permease protein